MDYFPPRFANAYMVNTKIKPKCYIPNDMHSDNNKPWKNVPSVDKTSKIKVESDNFQVNIDVQHFSPEELNVKVTDGHLIVEACHEEKEDEHGYVARSFSRRYAFPEHVDTDLVMSKLSSDGVLIVTAPKKKTPGGRVVPIIQGGPASDEVEDISHPH